MKLKEEKKRAKEHRIFMKRTSNSYASHQRRAEESAATLDYTLADLREMVRLELGLGCQMCGEPLTVKNFSCDHAQPTSRGGAFTAENINIVCSRCNQTKGTLTLTEYNQLLCLIESWPAEAKRSVLARLRAGGRIALGSGTQRRDQS